MQLDTLLSQRETQFVADGILLSMICYHLLFRMPLWSTWAMLWRPASERDEEKQNWEAHIVHYARKHYQNRRRETYELAIRMVVHLNGFGIVWAGLNVYFLDWMLMEKTAYILKSVLVYFAVNLVASLILDNPKAWLATRCAQWLLGLVGRGVAKVAAQCGIEIGCPQSRCGKALQLELPGQFEIAFAVIMVFMAIYEHLPGTQWGSMTLPRVAVSTFNGSTSQCMVWNALYHLSAILRWHFFNWSGTIVWFDIIFDLLLVTATSAALSKLAWQEALTATRARSQHTERKALFSMLNATCDAVVHLDDRFRVVGDTPKLAAMMLRPTSSIEGENFKDFVASEEDWDTVASILTDSKDVDGEFAKAFQTRVMDSMGNAVRLQGLHTTIAELDGGIAHLIGLSEAGAPRVIHGSVETMDQGSSQSPLPRRESSQHEGSLQPDSLHISLDEYPTTNTSAQTNSNSASASGIIPRPIGRARMLPMLPGIFGASDPGGAVEYQQFVDDFRAQAGSERQSDPLLYPDKLPTIQELALSQLLVRWNFPLLPRDCCHYHGAIRELKATTTRMNLHHCFSFNTESGGEQCRACGMLGCEGGTGRASPICGRCRGLLPGANLEL